jgi:hypothetical protein
MTDALLAVGNVRKIEQFDLGTEGRKQRFLGALAGAAGVIACRRETGENCESFLPGPYIRIVRVFYNGVFGLAYGVEKRLPTLPRLVSAVLSLSFSRGV